MNMITLSLADTQQAFQSAVLLLHKTTPDFIIDTTQASAAERFKVYTDAYRLRLIEALGADFPVLKSCLGNDGFDALGRAYIDTSPSDQFSVRWFGRHLPQFLAETMPYIKQPGLKDLATFEWTLSEAFDAAESNLVDYSQLAEIDPRYWSSLKLHFHPSLRRISLNGNAPQVWLASNKNQLLPQFILYPEPKVWIIWRQELKLLFRSLSMPEAFFLDAFMQGQPLAEICNGLKESLDEKQVVMQAAACLQTWLRDGWIADMAVDKAPDSLNSGLAKMSN